MVAAAPCGGSVHHARTWGHLPPGAFLAEHTTLLRVCGATDLAEQPLLLFPLHLVAGVVRVDPNRSGAETTWESAEWEALLGPEGAELATHVVESVKARRGPGEVLEEVAFVLDEDAEALGAVQNPFRTGDGMSFLERLELTAELGRHGSGTSQRTGKRPRSPPPDAPAPPAATGRPRQRGVDRTRPPRTVLARSRRGSDPRARTWPRSQPA